MAADLYSIGNFTFHGFDRTPPNYQRVITFENRAGSDYQSAWIQSVIGKTFRLQTDISVFNTIIGEQLVRQYKDAQLAALPLNIIWKNLDMGYTVIIQSVDADVHRHILNQSQIGTNYAAVKASWVLTVWQQK